MIELENLDNRSLDDILDEAKTQIGYLSTEWTNFQEADPGITLVELFSWLKAVQHEYLNREMPAVSLKLLKLLDVERRKNKGSTTLLEILNVKEDTFVPKRTQWKSGDMIFENVNYQTFTGSNILSVCFENPEMPSSEEYYKFDGNNVFYLFGKDIDRKNDKEICRRFIINFDSPISESSVVNLYFSVHVSKGLERNPIKIGDKFEKMADVEWEYYGEENGKLGWHKLTVVNDDTYNFLFSGIIRIKIPGKMSSIEGEYKIRATLINDEYDYPPRIERILTNVFKVKQEETLCENKIIKRENILSDRTVKLFSNLAVYGRSEVYYKKNGGWIKSTSPTFKSEIKKGTLIVDLETIWDKIKHLKSSDEAIMVVSYSQDVKNNVIIGSSTGISDQTLKFNIKNLLYDNMELLISEEVNGEETYFKWKRVDDFFSSGKYDRHFVYDEQNQQIKFGDHEHGMAPRVGMNNIKICSIKCTFGAESNIKSKMINCVSSMNKSLKKAGVSQIVDAVGGEDVETLQHASARAADIFNNSGRAVTIQDYENIVRATPGLTFSNVKILPNYMPGEDVSKQNCVTIAVRWNRKVGLTLPKSFEKNIMNHIEKYRLINTKIKVVSPEYIGITLEGEIVVDSSYRVSSREIEKELKKFINKINQDLGSTLHFSDIFGMIDRMGYVSRLNSLRIIPSGNFIKKTVAEDIIIPPNGVYYIEKTNFNYVKSSEIYRS